MARRKSGIVTSHARFGDGGALALGRATDPPIT